EEREKLHSVLRSYSQRVTVFLSHLLTPYAKQWRLDFASFRPIEERGRNVRHRARNDLLHVDSFPTRPTNGDRILRVFTNLNPTQAREWLTAEPFDVLAKQFAGTRGAPSVRPLSSIDRVRRTIGAVAKSVGLPVVIRSPYDQFMLKFHHYLKENSDFQAN